MHDKKEESCGAVVSKVEDGVMKYLLVHQLDGHWGFPKGHPHHRESRHECASREIFEETGIHVRFLHGFREKTHYKLKHKIQKTVVYFAGIYQSGTLTAQIDEVDQVVFASLPDAMRLLTYENDREILRMAVAFFRYYDDEGRRI